MTSLSIRKMNELSKKKKKGFTLVELIIVIAIIAILAAIAIPKFGQITRNANIKADIATAKNLHGIAAQLIAETGALDDDDIAAKVDGGVMPTPKTVPGGAFVVAVDDHDNITVMVGDDHVYPTQSGAFAQPS